MRPLRGTQSMNPHCFSPGRLFAFFSLLKPRNALSAAHSRYIFRWRFCTRNTRPSRCHWFSCLFLRRVVVISVSFSLFLSLSPNLSLSLSFSYIRVYICVIHGCARAFFTSLLCFCTCIYVCVCRDENPSLSLFYFLSLPLSTFIRSFSNPYSLSHSLFLSPRVTPIYATTIFHQFFPPRVSRSTRLERGKAITMYIRWVWGIRNRGVVPWALSHRFWLVSESRAPPEVRPQLRDATLAAVGCRLNWTLRASLVYCQNVPPHIHPPSFSLVPLSLSPIYNFSSRWLSARARPQAHFYWRRANAQPEQRGDSLLAKFRIFC